MDNFNKVILKELYELNNWPDIESTKQDYKSLLENIILRLRGKLESEGWTYERLTHTNIYEGVVTEYTLRFIQFDSNQKFIKKEITVFKSTIESWMEKYSTKEITITTIADYIERNYSTIDYEY